VHEKISAAFDYEKADLVLSDVAPEFMGEKYVDHMRSVYLNMDVLDCCNLNLKEGGNLLMKVFMGSCE